MINRDNVNAKREKIINLFDETMIDEANEKKNNNVEFKLKKKKTINFKIVTTTNEKKEKEMMMKKKISIENNDFYIFEVFDVKNSIERILIKYHFDDTTSILSFFKTSTFNVEIFLK